MPKAKIMIVEDERIVAADLEDKLLTMGYNVCGKAYSGKEALSIAEKKQLDLVLMDIKLEGSMDGIEAASLIKKRYGIPVIYLTAFSDENILQRAKITEPFGYLLKPFQNRELRSTIDMALYKRRVDKELLQAKKLESLGILAGGIAHDFNNILSIILGNIELLREDIKPQKGISEFFSEIEKASLQARELIKQLIMFAKVGSPVKKIGSIEVLVKETINSIPLCSNFKIEYFSHHNLWLVDFDEGQMKFALKNLIVNAVEAMSQGGLIDVRTENFEIRSETMGQSLSLSVGKYVKISVRDQGTGIPKEHIPMIFDPYFSTKDRGTQKGMGLGLSTTYSIIKRHDGHLTIESEVGVGTTFYLYLHAHKNDANRL
jgi:signal transduction histidine kinase